MILFRERVHGAVDKTTVINILAAAGYDIDEERTTEGVMLYATQADPQPHRRVVSTTYLGFMTRTVSEAAVVGCVSIRCGTTSFVVRGKGMVSAFVLWPMVGYLWAAVIVHEGIRHEWQFGRAQTLVLGASICAFLCFPLLIAVRFVLRGRRSARLMEGAWEDVKKHMPKSAIDEGRKWCDAPRADGE